MDKDNKYYSLIEKLVKNHRKYFGYEAIFEEIVDDVYNHSISVISTIDNEEVIQSYLQKVVSTSIITVPKRLNFNNAVKHRTITVDVPILKNEENVIQSTEGEKQESEDDIEKTKQIVSETEPINADSQEKYTEITNGAMEKFSAADTVEETRVNKELVDKMINSIETDSVIDTVDEFSVDAIKKENNTDDYDLATEDLSIQDEQIKNSEISSVNDLDNLEVEDADSLELLEDIEEYEGEDLSADIEEENVENDSLEKFAVINASEENQLNLTEVELSDEEVSDDTEIESLSYNNFEEKETELIENINLDIDEQDSVTDASEQADKSKEDVSKLELENTDDLELLPTDVDNEDSVLSEDFEPVTSVEKFDLIDSDLQCENSDDIELQQEDIFDVTLGMANDENLNEELVIQDDIQEVDLEGSELLDDSLNISENIETLGIIDKEIATQEEIVHKAVDYSAFNYTPIEEKASNIDTNTISNKLINLSNNKPELNILKIFDLKYKQNQTIEYIAKELNVDKNIVITALDEIVDLI